MVVEAALEVIATAASRRDVAVGGDEVERAVVAPHIAERHLRRVAGSHLRQRELDHAVDDAAEVYHKASLSVGYDARGLQRFLHATRLAELRRHLHTFHPDDIDGLPGHLVETRCREGGRHDAGIDEFAPHLVGLPRAPVAIAAPGALPAAVGTDDERGMMGRGIRIAQLGLDEGTLVLSPEGFRLIPA